ncbi:MAG: NAD(P)/FAD-dependent oxidoreductase [Acidimicrobiales bacterium]
MRTGPGVGPTASSGSEHGQRVDACARHGRHHHRHKGDRHPPAQAAGSSASTPELVEAGTGVGSTWYWNRYREPASTRRATPTSYFFSQRSCSTSGSGRSASRPGGDQRYLNHVTDKLDLRGLMRFHPHRVGRLRQASTTWTLTTEDGEQLRCRFLISITEVLSVPYWPAIPGRERYRGEAYHTGQWPKEPVEFAGKKVAVIGTGASAVQLIPEIAKEVAELVVYQRTPNWNSPLNNGKITDGAGRDPGHLRADLRVVHGSFAEVRAPRLTQAHLRPKDERWALYEQLYHQKGFAKLISNYRDLMTNREANAEFSSSSPPDRGKAWTTRRWPRS